MSSPVQRKIEFIWTEPRPPIAVPGRLSFQPVVEGVALELLLRTIADALGDSLDAGHRQTVARVGARAFAERFIAPDRGLVFEQSWWHLSLTARGDVVGFHMPVAFRGCAQDGKDECTLRLIGVVPAFRGHGYIDDILAHATRTMQERGTWRIYCDTDVTNLPMVAAFERVGYERGRIREVPIEA